LRDGAYNLLAVNRYRWFGKADMCRVPTPEMRERFLA
jgi:predicted DCC family thiol-disulfide oxidoreductase YuxK